MPAEKTRRKQVRAWERNRAWRTSARTATRKARRAILSEDAAQAEQELRQAASVLDRAAQKGGLHRNTAARHKARLARLLNQVAKR